MSAPKPAVVLAALLVAPATSPASGVDQPLKPFAMQAPVELADALRIAFGLPRIVHTRRQVGAAYQP